MDADLVRVSHRRFVVSLRLFAVAVVLVGVDWAAHLQGRTHDVVIWIAIGFFVTGAVGIRWASAEETFLHRPDPKEPPSLFKS